MRLKQVFGLLSCQELVDSAFFFAPNKTKTRNSCMILSCSFSAWS